MKNPWNVYKSLKKSQKLWQIHKCINKFPEAFQKITNALKHPQELWGIHKSFKVFTEDLKPSREQIIKASKPSHKLWNYLAKIQIRGFKASEKKIQQRRIFINVWHHLCKA